jgi:hypothetical protein
MDSVHRSSGTFGGGQGIVPSPEGMRYHGVTCIEKVARADIVTGYQGMPAAQKWTTVRLSEIALGASGTHTRCWVVGGCESELDILTDPVVSCEVVSYEGAFTALVRPPARPERTGE